MTITSPSSPGTRLLRAWAAEFGFEFFVSQAGSCPREFEEGSVEKRDEWPISLACTEAELTASSRQCSPCRCAQNSNITWPETRHVTMLLLYCVSFLTSPQQCHISATVSSPLIGFWGGKKGRKKIPQSFTVHFHHALCFSVLVAVVIAFWDLE
jgi:hypothetical protein